MSVAQDRIRAQVLGAGGEGWDCAGVSYGVPEPPMDGGPAYPQPHPWSPSDPVVVFPFGGLGQASDIPPSRAQEGSFPVGDFQRFGSSYSAADEAKRLARGGR